MSAALGSAVPGMGGGGPSFKSSSNAEGRSGDLVSPFNYDTSGFSVNYGNGVNQGASKSPLPSSVWMIAALVVGAVVWKRYA